jgi:hypothetical protein
VPSNSNHRSRASAASIQLPRKTGCGSPVAFAAMRACAWSPPASAVVCCHIAALCEGTCQVVAKADSLCSEQPPLLNLLTGRGGLAAESVALHNRSYLTGSQLTALIWTCAWQQHTSIDDDRQCVNLRTFCQYSHSGGGGGGAGSCALLFRPNVMPELAATGGCDARGVMRRMSSPSQISTGSMTSGTSSAGDHLGALAVTAAPLPCMHASMRAVLAPPADAILTCSGTLMLATCFYRLADQGDNMQPPCVQAGCKP